MTTSDYAATEAGSSIIVLPINFSPIVTGSVVDMRMRYTTSFTVEDLNTDQSPVGRQLLHVIVAGQHNPTA